MSREANDFAIIIDYKSGEGDPARIFKTAISLINEFSNFDRQLLRGVDPRLVPTLLLDDVEEGSLKIRLRTALRAVDDDALKSGDWKKLVGAFLFQAKYKLLKYLEDEGDHIAVNPVGIEQLRTELEQEARNLEVETVPISVIPPRSFFVLQIVELSAAVAPLKPGEFARLEDRAGRSVTVSPSLRLTEEDVERLTTAQTPIFDSQVILPVKKPDLIGDSRWEFILDGHAIEAKLLDLDWVADFRRQRVPLLPGSSLNVTLRQSVSFGFDQERLSTKYFIMKVHGIVDPPDTRGLQLTLPG